jgi:phosphocarrier protein
MPSITVTVGAAVGLHARPATIVAARVDELGTEITLAKPGGAEVNADSALAIMSLGAARGDEVVVTCGDERACRIIADLVASDLDA